MATTSVAPIALQQINQDFYVGRGFLHSIQDAVDYAAKTGQPSLVIIPQGYYGPDQISEVLRGENWIYVVDQRNYNPFFYYWTGTIYDGPFIDLNGKLLENTTLDLNGNNLTITGEGDTLIGGTDANTATVISQGGSILTPDLTAEMITAENADFAECTVDNSPVRTFENSPDPGGWMIYPEPGIAVSAGDEWDNSIDPATLATTAQLSAQLSNFIPNVFSTTQIVNTNNYDLRFISTTNPGTGAGSLSLEMGGDVPGIVMTGYPGNPNEHITNIIGYGNGFAIAAQPDDRSAVNPWIVGHRSGATPSDVSFLCNTFTTGASTVYGDVTATGDLIQLMRSGVPIMWMAGGVSGYPQIYMNSIWAEPDNAKFILAHTNYLSFQFLDANNNMQEWLQVARSGNTATNLWFSAPLNAPAKNFVIPHPSDPKKQLVHSAVEGPEHSVFYRGEGVTKAGFAEIKLPEYFEKLTIKEGRTVQVTPLYEDEDETFAQCGASRVKNGKFSVWSAEPRQKFYWEVKAIRADIAPLEVVIDARPQPKSVAVPKKSKR